jgi:proteic killer suppression protein
MIVSFRSRALRRYWTKGDESGLRPDWRGRIRRQLLVLEQAHRPEEADLPGWGFHTLRGDQAGRYALLVSRNWRLTFGWDGQDAVEVDLEDYHGG